MMAILMMMVMVMVTTVVRGRWVSCLLAAISHQVLAPSPDGCTPDGG